MRLQTSESLLSNPHFTADLPSLAFTLSRVSFPDPHFTMHLLPRPSLCHLSLSSALTPPRGPQHHFLFFNSRTTSLPRPAPHRTSLTPTKHRKREGHSLLLGSHALPLSTHWSSFLHVLPPYAIVPPILSRLFLACGCAKQPKTYFFFKKLLIEPAN